MIPDQKQLWNKKHSNSEHEEFRNIASTFARIVLTKLKPKSKLLELGCGVGRDAVLFHEHGHEVIATDFSDVAISLNKDLFKNINVEFRVLDMAQPLPFKDETFDVVYSNLALHYYGDTKTKEVVREVRRVLKPGGLLAFACKTVNDAHYGNGEELENNMFLSETGHVRHLFTKEYALEILDEKFKTIYLEEIVEEHWGQKSAIIHCIAQKI